MKQTAILITHMMQLWCASSVRCHVVKTPKRKCSWAVTINKAGMYDQQFCYTTCTKMSAYWPPAWPTLQPSRWKWHDSPKISELLPNYMATHFR